MAPVAAAVLASCIRWSRRGRFCAAAILPLSIAVALILSNNGWRSCYKTAL
ncbi:hypothetical protein HMPREF9946_04469 [Acetobacteraceae bacterium AT-5844]|nr:hypothetical protein HMPREF9946_04469 [Acetobacteraceae bacterium AT-5844]